MLFCVRVYAIFGRKVQDFFPIHVADTDASVNISKCSSKNMGQNGYGLRCLTVKNCCILQTREIAVVKKEVKPEDSHNKSTKNTTARGRI